MRRIIHAENTRALVALPKEFAELVYIDPPFNTGEKQSRARVRVVQDEEGDRAGFGGRRYRSESVTSAGSPIETGRRSGIAPTAPDS